MKQRYKVFINDHWVEFLKEDFPGSLIKNYITDSYNFDQIVKIVGAASGSKSMGFGILTPDPALEMKTFCKAFKNIRAAGGVVINRALNDRILMILRFGKWDLPKGKMEDGENENECAIREVEEECGISGLTIEKRLPDTFHMYPHKGNWVVKQTTWFLMETRDCSTPSPQIEEHITEARWVNVEDLPSVLKQSYASIADLMRMVFPHPAD